MKPRLILFTLIGIAILALGIWAIQTRRGDEPRITAETAPTQTTAAPSPTPAPTPVPEATLIAVGDVMLSREVAKKIIQHGLDYPYKEIATHLRSAHGVFANLETPITAGRAIEQSEMTFRADPGVEHALRQAGVTIVSLANNHTPNFGQKGLLDTFTYLNNAGVAYVGAGRDDTEAYAHDIITLNGIRIAFLAYNDDDVVPASYKATPNRAGTAFMDIPRMTASVTAAKKEADLVFVSMHSGTEYVAKPNTSQTTFARAAIDAGADAVIGHHPHVVQTAEIYKGKPILYSLGNFVFDQMWSQDTRRGMAVKLHMTPAGITKMEFQPILISNYAQASLLTGADAETVLARLELPLTNGVYAFSSSAD